MRVLTQLVYWLLHNWRRKTTGPNNPFQHCRHFNLQQRFAPSRMRIFGPDQWHGVTVALFYGICSISMNFLNKVIVSTYEFNYPYLIMTCQVKTKTCPPKNRVPPKQGFAFSFLADDCHCDILGPFAAFRMPRPQAVFVSKRSRFSTRIPVLCSSFYIESHGSSWHEYSNVWSN